MIILTNWTFDLTAEQVLRVLESNPENARDSKPHLYQLADKVIYEGLPLLDPKVILETYQVNQLIHQKLELQANDNCEHYYLTGPLVVENLATAEKVIAMVCTIGDMVEKRAAEVMKFDLLYGWTLDSLGSAAIESLATQACKQIETQAEAEFMKSTAPLSPGMIGWPVDIGQIELFKLINPSLIDVSLNKNHQMQPCKTLSLVVGIGSKVNSRGKTCDFCALSKTCRYKNHIEK